jgi:2,5-furandicarboxylate decarboxylase 1
MPYQDFRQFVDALKRAGDLIEVSRPIDLKYEVGKALKQSYVHDGPAIVFANNGTEFPLVAGIYGNRRKALLAFEATEETIVQRVLHGLENPIPPTIVSGTAPCHDVVLVGNQIDIQRFPVPIYSPKDGGPFITAGIVVSKDPETGVFDIGHYRHQILGERDRMAFTAQPFHRFGKNIAKCVRMGVAAQGALVVGVDPVLAYAAQTQVGDATDDWHVAGGLRGAPVELVSCKTVDLKVPAAAEVVIEYVVDIDHKVMEGPLGEYTGYYTPASLKPTARITAITHRRKPYFQGLLTGKPVTENHILKQIPFEASLWKAVKSQFPTVEQVAVTPSGGVSFYVVIAMRPRFAGEARQAILAAMASNIRPKWVIVVEPDINIHDPAEVEWAMSFRVRPENDVVVIGETPAGPADPAVGDTVTMKAPISSVVGIDATRAFGEKFAEVADVPGWQDYRVPELLH